MFLIKSSVAQEQINPNGYNTFYYENGKKSSEGYMKDGKPDGYWKTYNEQRTLISEGNRKNFLLDSTWKFYNNEGKLKLEINYLEGKKHGPRISYREKEVVKENFADDLKQGLTIYSYTNGRVKKTLNFIDGLENGLAKIYDTSGIIIELITYKKGFITDREKINRRDQKGKKHGKWKEFYENGILKKEGTYKHGLEHGYFKEYDIESNLVSAAKYVNGEKQMNVAELKKLDVITEYYPSGNVKIKATYKDKVPEGIWREYSEEGEVEKSYVYKNGVVIGEGIITEKGEKNGEWKEYYNDGQIKAEGKYDHDAKIEEWKFYHKNGKTEQIGSYTKEGKLTGIWKWYYSSGLLLREESFYEDKPDGVLTEYDELSNIITQGEFINGLEEGFWYYNLGDQREEGEYVEGLMDGWWKHFYNDGTISFEGRFIEGNPHGRHVYYRDNGNIKDEGYYVMGIKHGQWTSYNKDGTPYLVITYQNGIEKKYDGIKIIPEFKPDDFE